VQDISGRLFGHPPARPASAFSSNICKLMPYSCKLRHNQGTALTRVHSAEGVLECYGCYGSTNFEIPALTFSLIKCCDDVVCSLNKLTKKRW